MLLKETMVTLKRFKRQLPIAISAQILVFSFLTIVFYTNAEHVNRTEQFSDPLRADPTVFIATFVRNKAHTLPYFLTLLEQLDYPKDRIAIWIRSDHNEDTTVDVLSTWNKRIESTAEYHSFSSQVVDAPPFRQSDQDNSPLKWTPKRFRHLIRLKEEALRVAKKMWADYIWFLDADAFLVNNHTLRELVSKNKRIVAPMLISGDLYSNFWAGMVDYYYQRTDRYKQILQRKVIGCFEVPMIHSAVLMDLRYKEIPGFKEPRNSNTSNPVPEDDIIRFAINAKNMGIQMEICNDLEYGAILAPLEDDQDLARDDEQLHNLRVEVASYWYPPMKAAEDLKKWAQVDPSLTTVGFDQVYMINLKRRPDRLNKMTQVLKILGIEFQLLEATDGKDLNPAKLDQMGIKLLAEYRDPYSKRIMTYGEIGCFLSHYRVWQDMLKNHYQTALILEDDIRFEPYFVFQLKRLFEEAGDLKLNWDLIYLGRKRPSNAQEEFVPGSNLIVQLGYSYWTLGYAITLRGVKKLIEAKPLEKMVPIDEFLPIMFNRHANYGWMASFPVRNLRAYSAEPLLLYPTHYTGEVGYISDTETSSIVKCSQTKNCTIKDEL